MASSIDKNPHNTLAQHESAQAHTPAPAPSKPQAAAKKASAGEAPRESFSASRDPSAQKATVAQPMLGAFAKSAPKSAAGAKPQAGTGSLMEQQNVMAAASNVLNKTSNVGGIVRKAAGGAGMSALGVSLAAPFLAIPAALGAVALASGAGLLARRSARQTIRQDADLQGDVDVLKAAVDRISKLENPSQIEKVTLGAAQKGLAGVKS